MNTGHSSGNPFDVSVVRRVGEKIRANIETVMVLEKEITDNVIVAALAGGHILFEDVPGVGKTMLARTIAVCLGANFGRIQCTPDLLPSDVVGVSVYNEQTKTFEYRPGPIMNQVVLADELNRATPRTQSSMLECMAEGQVTVDGVTRRLPRPFIVLATQNPIDYEGTFPLPEAQLDRFLLKSSIGYPSAEGEQEVLRRMYGSNPLESLKACTTPEEFALMQQVVRRVHVDPSILQYVVQIVRRTREHPDVQLGASPRGTIALTRAAQARAALHGRAYVLPDDVKRLVGPVLNHRLILKPESRLRNRRALDLIDDIVNNTPVKFEDEL